MVTPRVEASPDRSDFAKLGETIAASLVVQAAQEHANHAGVLLGQTRQRADDIRSQVAESRELAEMNERLMAFGDSLLAAHRKFLGSEFAQHHNTQPHRAALAYARSRGSRSVCDKTNASMMRATSLAC